MTDLPPAEPRRSAEPYYSILAWSFVFALLIAGCILSWLLFKPPLEFKDGLKLLSAIVGIPAFVGVAFYGRLSVELTGVLLAVILGFVFGSALH
jgi:hypothetical protein